MRFALIDKRRVEACPGLTGLCPNCGQKVIAKCGSQRIHHWAHYNNQRKYPVYNLIYHSNNKKEQIEADEENSDPSETDKHSHE